MTGSVTLRRAYTDCRFGQMHYLEGRPAQASVVTGPTLVLLHQNPSTSWEYEPLVRAMAQDRRVIAFDTPGYGMSDPPPGPLSIADYAAAFSDALDAMSLALDGPVDAFGYHSGALLAVELGLQRPEAVGRLILSGVPMRSSEECADRLEKARNSAVSEDGAALLAQSAALWNYVVTKRDPRVPLDRAAMHFTDKNKPLHRTWWVYEGVWSYPARARLPLITQPTLLLQPHDMLLQETRDASALIPQNTLVELPYLDRDIFEIGSEPIAAALRAFLSSKTPVPETAP